MSASQGFNTGCGIAGGCLAAVVALVVGFMALSVLSIGGCGYKTYQAAEQTYEAIDDAVENIPRPEVDLDDDSDSD